MAGIRRGFLLRLASTFRVGCCFASVARSRFRILPRDEIVGRNSTSSPAGQLIARDDVKQRAGRLQALVMTSLASGELNDGAAFELHGGLR